MGQHKRVCKNEIRLEWSKHRRNLVSFVIANVKINESENVLHSETVLYCHLLASYGSASNIEYIICSNEETSAQCMFNSTLDNHSPIDEPRRLEKITAYVRKRKKKGEGWCQKLGLRKDFLRMERNRRKYV